MGVDIHSTFQIRKNDSWADIPDLPDLFVYRCYAFFDILNEIKNPGLPEEVKGKKYHYDKEYDYWLADFSDGCEDWYYGFGYITYAELPSYIKHNNPYFVSFGFYEKFLELGGVFPEGMVFENGENNTIQVNIFDNDDSIGWNCLMEAKDDFAEIMEKHNIKSPDDIRVIIAFDC
ncbi:MAG: hypothetical protein ACI4WM_02780 [Erysipelotrichaceae bacterium]